MRKFVYFLDVLNGIIRDGRSDALAASDLPDSGVTAGAYTNPTVTFDAKGRATAAASTSGSGGLYVPTLTPVVAASMTWVNQQSSTFTDATGAFVSNNAGTAGGGGGANDSLNVLVKTAPSTPYTAAVLFRASGLGFNCHFGALFRNSSSGKLLAMNVLDNGSGALFLRASKWTTIGTFSANYKFTAVGTSMFNVGDVWLRLSDDGTNLKFQVSGDGLNWMTYDTEARTDFAVPDQVGFYACVNTTTQVYPLQVLSFAVG